MNVYLKEILIFNQQGEKRNVPFLQGLNIITGNSKTGKSALIEIVDYCLCSSKSTIPQGVITDWSYLFAIVLAFKGENRDKFLVLGRKKYTEGGNHKMYFSVETDEKKVENIQYSYFEEIQEEIIKGGVQTEIEKHLGLNVSNMPNDETTISASLRNIVSFLFQHQNLIANKHAIFYRFEDYTKRKQVVDQFPIFAGWVNAEYYSLKTEIDEKNEELKKIERLKKRKIREEKEAFDELSIYFKNYYYLIGEEFPNVNTVEKLFDLQAKMPNYEVKALLSSDIEIKYNSLIQQQNDLRAELDKYIIKRQNLENSQNYASTYNESLLPLNSRAEKSNINISNTKCPICGKEDEDLKEQKVKILEAKRKIRTELKNVQKYNISFHKEIDKIKQTEKGLNITPTPINALLKNIKT